MNRPRGMMALGLIAAIALGLLVAINASALARGNQGFEDQASAPGGEEEKETQVFPPIQPLPPFSHAQRFSVQSFVQDVRVYSITVLGDKQIAVGLRFNGDGETPGVTVIAFTGMLPLPLRGIYPSGTELQPLIDDAGDWSREKPEIYPLRDFTLMGSNIAAPGWSTPATVTVSLVGEGSLLEASHIEVAVVPYIPS